MEEMPFERKLQMNPESGGEFTGRIDHDTVRVRNRGGKEVTFMIDPHVRVDEIIEQVRAHNHPLDYLELKTIMPLTVYTSREVESTGAPGDVPGQKPLLDSDIPRLFGLDAEEFHRMESWARKALYTDFARRLGVVTDKRG